MSYIKKIKYRIEIWSFGEKINEVSFTKDEFDEAKRFYEIHSKELCSAAPVVYVNDKQLNIIESDKLFKRNRFMS